MKKLGQITQLKKRKGVGIISDINGNSWYCYGYHLKRGQMYKFSIDENDPEIAVDLEEVYFPFRIHRYTLEENLMSLVVAIVLGLILTVFLIQTVHAEDMSANDIHLIAKLVSAEAENQPFDGKKLVVSVLLNRIDNEQFPNTVKSVIMQQGQFSVIENGAWDKAIPTEEDYEAVRQELKQRSNNEIIYFTAGKYGKYGKPVMQLANHYFSK